MGVMETCFSAVMCLYCVWLVLRLSEPINRKLSLTVKLFLLCLLLPLPWSTGKYSILDAGFIIWRWMLDKVYFWKYKGAWTQVLKETNVDKIWTNMACYDLCKCSAFSFRGPLRTEGMKAAGIHWVISRTGGRRATNGLTAVKPSPFVCHFWGLPHPLVSSTQQTVRSWGASPDPWVFWDVWYLSEQGSQQCWSLSTAGMQHPYEEVSLLMSDVII